MSKPKLYNGTEWIEFETAQEFEDYLRINHPSPDMSDYIKSQEHEMLGKEVVRDLYVMLRRNNNLSQAQEGDLIGRIYPVLGALGDGFIRGARVIANSLPVTGQLTQARKDYLIGKIDEAISKL